jgi:N-acetylglucosaminyldiphosphoundecaprenol N-acetyl-beta-D-mannosaminyltransferase
MKELSKINFFGLGFSVFTENELLTYINESIFYNHKRIFYGYSLATIVLFKKYKDLYLHSNSSDLIVTDGQQMFWLIKLLRYPIGFNISIPSLVNMVLKEANIYKYSIMLIGGTEDIKINAENRIREKYSNIKIISGFNGYFDNTDESKIISEINSKSPNILLLGISSPKKEEIAYNWKQKINVNIIIPMGGMIDVLAGKTKQSPPWVKKMGLATPYRVFQEPRRLFLVNVWFTFEIVFKIIPIIIFKHLTNKKNYNITDIYH